MFFAAVVFLEGLVGVVELIEFLVSISFWSCCLSSSAMPLLMISWIAKRAVSRSFSILVILDSMSSGL